MPRTLFASTICSVALAILTGFRFWLYRERHAALAGLTSGQRLKLFWIGLRLDGVTVSRCCLPVALGALLLPGAVLAVTPGVIAGYAGLVYFLLFFVELAGIYFFRFYDFRPNYLVFEHGADREVVKTVLKAYPVGRILLGSLAGAAAAVKLTEIVAWPAAGVFVNESPWSRDRAVSFLLLTAMGLATRGTLDHRPLNPSLASFTTNRIANEIANSGLFNLLYEWSQRAKNHFAALKSLVQLPPLD
jgi:hypothetical protein